MQSDSIEAEAEISSLPTKTTHLDESDDTDNHYEAWKANLSKQVSLENSSRSLVVEDSEKGSKRGNDRGLEHEERPEASTSAITPPPQDEIIAENDMPYDQAYDTCSSIEKNRESWSRSNATNGNRQGTSDCNNTGSSKVSDLVEPSHSPISPEVENVCLSPIGGRFLVPPPKYSNLCYDDSFDNEIALLSDQYQNEQKQTQTVSRLSSIPKEISEKYSYDEYSNLYARKDGSQDTKKITQDRDAKYENGGGKNANNSVKVRQRSKQRRKQHVRDDSTCTDDETSIENYGGFIGCHSIGLQERAQQAWKSRQRKTSTIKSRQGKVSNVSFGNSNTVHHFNPGDNYRQLYHKEDDDDVSLDRSLNSEYTKSLESEVEDVIKDIFLIGNPRKSKPGRRKFRHKAEIEKKMKDDRIGTEVIKNDNKAVKGQHLHKMSEEKGDDQYSSAVMASNKIHQQYDLKDDKSRSKCRASADDKYSVASSTISGGSSADSNTVETDESEKDVTDDPLNTMIGLVEGGLSVMSSALEYALGDKEATETREDTIDNCQKIHCQKATSDFDIFESCGIHSSGQKVTPNYGEVVTQARYMLPNDTSFLDSSKNASHRSTKPGSSKNASIRSTKPERKTKCHEPNEDDKRLLVTQILSLGKSSEVIRLAMYAARSVHKLQGVEYDKSVPIDMHKEVKQCHVTLSLPLGSEYILQSVEVFII